MLDQISLSPQVEGSVIINNKPDLYMFPQKFLNEFRLRMLGN